MYNFARSTSYLTFDQYRFYLQKEVFAALPDKVSERERERCVFNCGYEREKEGDKEMIRVYDDF